MSSVDQIVLEARDESMMEPSADHDKAPLWIKIMWVCEIAWVIGYVILGFQRTPTTW